MRVLLQCGAVPVSVRDFPPAMQFSPRRLVMKFGSGILTRPDTAALDESQFARLCQAIAILKQDGLEVIVVSSGAVAAGLPVLGMTRRPESTAMLQACAAVGQTRLMNKYTTLLGACGLHTGQLLLTHGDLEHPDRRANLENTLQSLLGRENVVPIVNENDPVATEELRFGDNDTLSAHLAIVSGAHHLMILTSVDGLYAPGEPGRVIGRVDDIDQVMGYATDARGDYSVGGMASKLRAVAMATRAGIEVTIASGRRTDQIPDLLHGKGICTRFTPAAVRRTGADAAAGS